MEDIGVTRKDQQDELPAKAQEAQDQADKARATFIRDSWLKLACPRARFRLSRHFAEIGVLQ
jgi:hypothetical protein